MCISTACIAMYAYVFDCVVVNVYVCETTAPVCKSTPLPAPSAQYAGANGVDAWQVHLASPMVHQTQWRT